MSTETSVPLPRMSPSDSDLLATILAEAPFGFALFDTASRFRRVNPALARVYGRSEEECAGRVPSEVLADSAVADAHEAAIARVLSGEPVVAGGALPAPSAGGSTARWALSWFPAFGDGGAVQGVALIAVDLSDRLRAEDRYRSLLRATSQVVWAAGPDGAIEEDCPEWRAITGQSRAEYLEHGWLAAVHPDDQQRITRSWGDAVADRAVFDETYRVRTPSGDARHFRSRAVPMMRGEELAEWVGAHTDVTTQHEADDMRQRLTQQLGEAALRTVRLQKATADLAEALTVEQVVRVMGEIGRAAVGADRTAVAELGDGRSRLRVIGRAGSAPRGEDGGSGGDLPQILSLAVREQRPCIAGGPAALRELLGEDPEAERFLAATDERSWVALPLLSGGTPVGALRFAFTAARDVSDDDKVFLEALAGQCALALERARLFEREHRTAEALQASLLPEALPEVQGVRMQAFYRSGTQHVQVGGDWYDAFPLPDGRIAGVLGDVMGKGIKAATGMSRVRNALRALAFSMPEPADVLTGLDRMFDATEAVDQVTTLVYFVLDPSTGQIDLSNAGHLPPLVVTGGTEPSLLETQPDTPLGVRSERGHHKFFVQPGNTVVLYSDGLVENRKRSVASGLDELVAVASRAPSEVVGDPQLMLQYFVEGMLAGYEQDDDVTLLAVHLPVIEAAPEE